MKEKIIYSFERTVFILKPYQQMFQCFEDSLWGGEVAKELRNIFWKNNKNNIIEFGFHMMWSSLSAGCEGLGIILSLRESSLGDSLGGAQKGERACSRISEVWIPLPVPPVAPRWLTCQILGNQHGAEISTECKQTLKSMWKINFARTNKALKVHLQCWEQQKIVKFSVP